MRIFLLTILTVIANIAFADGLERIESRLDSLMKCRYESGLAPGGAILVKIGNEVVIDKGYGYADLQSGAKIDGNTMFNIASVTKQFTAAAIMLLQERGLLSVEDAVSKYFDYGNGNWNVIKLKHLLSHTSGVPDLRPRTDMNWMLTVTDKESMEYLDTLSVFKFRPGEFYDYINPTFQILAATVEKVAKVSFEEFVHKEVFAKAGMDKAVYFSADKEIPLMAHGYVFEESKGESDFAGKVSGRGKKIEGLKWAEYDYGEETFFATKADGGIYTSTRQFMAWEDALESDSILSRQAKEDMYSPKIEVSGSPFCSYQNLPNTYYGYGFFICRKPGYPEKVYHVGDNGGFQIYAAKYPIKKVKILVFENRNDKDRQLLVDEIDRILMEEGQL